MWKRCLFFCFILILSISYGCSARKGISSSPKEPPLEILFPSDNVNLPSGNVVVLAAMSNLLQKPLLYVDGKTIDYKLQNTSVPGLHLFYVNLTPGKHTLEVVASGPDVKAYKEAISKGNDYREIEKSLKDVKWRQYKRSIRVTVLQEQQILKLLPVDYSEYLSAKQPLGNAPVYRIIPPGSNLLVATGKESVLVRTKKGMSESYWVLPAMDENKAEDIFENRKPILNVVHDKNSFIEVPPPVACYGSKDVFVVLEYKKVEKNYAFVYHFLYEDGSAKTVTVGEREIINKIFDEGLNPWKLKKEDLLKDNRLGVMPSMAAPLICTDKAVTQEVYLDCIWVKCKPSTVAFHLLVSQDGSFRVLRSLNSVTEIAWHGREVLLPVTATKWAMFDLKEGVYQLLDEDRQYRLPFKTALPAQLSSDYYFQGRTLKPITQPWDVQLALKEDDSSIYSLYEIFFGRRLLLKTTLMFVHRWQGESRFEEVPVWYEVSVSD